MFEIIILWVFLGFLSFGMICFNYIYALKYSKKPWNLKIDKNYRPKVTIIIPTYNEAKLIKYKFMNLMNINYDKNLMEIIFVDSKSEDSTIDIIKKCSSSYADMNIKIIKDEEKKGKSNALNLALNYCRNEIVIVSDADCFWNSDILIKSLSFLSDPTIGAISGQKKLINDDSWVSKHENKYIEVMNSIKLSDSKLGSTVLFEGGFSAFKKELLDAFDPYSTGSDDCGTVISILEKNFKTIMVPNAEIYTIFPDSFSERLNIKIRRATQLIHVFWMYLINILNNNIINFRGIIARHIYIYIFNPIFFLLFMIMSFYLLINFPILGLSILIFFIPKVNKYVFEMFFGFFILIIALSFVLVKKRYLFWKKHEERKSLNEDILRKYDLI